MAECRNPGQVDGLEDILKTKPSVERDQRIRELVAALAKERDTLKDHLSIVEDKGFVLVLGDDTLKQQVADLKEQLRVLQIAADTYKEDFLRERNDRASAHGAKDDFKKAMEKTEAENRQLKQRLVRSDSTNRSNTNGGNRSPENSTASDQKCRELRNHVHQLEEVVQQLQRQLERALAESIELNELKCRQKQQEEYAHALEQERDQLRQQIVRSSHNDVWLSRSNGHLPLRPAVRGGRPVMLTNIGGENIPVYHGVQFPVRDKPIPMHCSEMFPGLQDQRPVFNPFESEDGPPIRAIDPGLMHTEGGVPNHYMLGQYNHPTSPIASSARPSNMYAGQQSTNSYGNLSPSTPSPHTDAALERNDSPVFSGSFDESPCNERRQPQYNASNVPMPQQQPNIPTNYHVNPHQQGAQTLYRNLPLHLSHPGGAGIPSPNTRKRFEQPQTQSPSQPPSLPPKQRQNYDYPRHMNSDRDQILPALPPKPNGNFQSRQLQYSTPHREEIATPPLPPKPARAEQRNTAGYCESKAAALQTIGDQPENVTISDLPPSHIVATSSSYMLDGLDGKDSRSRDTNEHAPFDPNLVCPVCKKNFRYDETQKCGAHVRRCLGDREERVQEWNHRMASGTEPFSQQHSLNKTSSTAERTRSDTEDSRPPGQEKRNLVSRGAGDDILPSPPTPIPRKRSIRK